MDEADFAQLHESMARESALAMRAARAARNAGSARVAGAAERQSGLCADCGEPIPAARLAAIPNAARCVACQSELEE